MPCIQVKTNTSISAAGEIAVKTALGNAIEMIPGKNEQWLMLVLEGNASIYFRGDNSKPSAWVQVSCYGKSDPADYSRLSGEICAILEKELGIAPSQTYIKYDETQSWGWNGTNF